MSQFIYKLHKQIHLQLNPNYIYWGAQRARRGLAEGPQRASKGRAEGVYQHALSVELQEKNIQHTMEEVITIPYKGVTVGHERADINIYRETFPAVLEMKATNSPIQPKEHWQVISYMRALKRSFGAVINFNQSPKGQLQVDCIILTDDGKPYLWDPDTGTIIGEPLSDYE
jgi:GxxExxY protein